MANKLKQMMKKRNKDDGLLESYILNQGGYTPTCGIPALLSYKQGDGSTVLIGDLADDDGRSIDSFSTTSTADNIPGTGRTVDNYLYRPIGGFIERLVRSPVISPSSGALNLGAGIAHHTFISPIQMGSNISQDSVSASTVLTYSTMATMDDNPGPGRAIDKYFYQPAGRKVEAWAGRIAISYLPPGNIFRYLSDNTSMSPGIRIPESRPASIVTVKDLWIDDGAAIIDGWKALIKQTK